MTKLNAMRSSRFAILLLGLFGSVIAMGFHTLLWSTNPLSVHIDGLSIIWLGFFGVVFLSKTGRLGKELLSYASINSKFQFWVILLFFALLFRSQVMFAIPYLADDYQRYLFDGNLILAGINPYSVQPLSIPQLGGADIPKPEVTTIYPPLAEGLFAVASWVGGTLWHWRIMNLIPDLMGAAIFYRLLLLKNLPPYWIIFWLWNPLIIKEGLHAAHLDIWTLLAVLLFVYWAEQGRLKAAALSLGAAVLLKLIPLILLPAWLLQLPNQRSRLTAISIVSGVFVGGFAWFLPWHPFGNLAMFLQHIQGYGVLFLFLQNGFGLWEFEPEWIKWLLTSIGGALYLYWLWVLKRYHSRSPSHFPELFILLFVFSSMGFPWYLLVALPWVLLHGHWIWMLFFALSQLIFYSHQIQESSTPLAIAAFIVLLLAVRQQTQHEGNNYAFLD